MRKRIYTVGLVGVFAACSLFGCSGDGTDNAENESIDSMYGQNPYDNMFGNESDSQQEEEADSSTAQTTTKFDITSESVEENEVTVAVKENGTLSGEGADVTVESTEENTIHLSGDSVDCSCEGVNVDKTTITITKAGTYVVTGELTDGQIVVDTEDKETVWIILSNANITSEKNAAIYVVNAKKTILSAATGTTNTLTDATEYTYEVEEDEEPNACVFSKDDLVISGDGALTVNGNFNNGIASKDTLEISDIKLTVNAINNAIKGKDYVVIKSGDITVSSEADGIKSDNTEDTSLGYILIEDGKIKIEAGEDAIQAQTCLKITGGDIDIKTGDGSSVSSTSSMWGGSDTSSDTSKKAIKAGVDITVTGGNISIDSQDDAMHSNNSLEIAGGKIEITSGDDGLHSDTELLISGGEINITKSYEGIESSKIVISGGTTNVVASDDGINAAGGNDGSSQNSRPGMNNFSSSTGEVVISGGYLYMNASGDGLDSNGSIEFTGGTVYVDGPENDGNGAMDYDSTFTMTGGILVAAGSSGMLQSVSTSSTQYCITTVAQEYQSAGTEFTLTDSEGNEVLSYTPAKKYNSVVVCIPEIEEGETYTASMGSEEIGTVTVSSIVNTIGSAAGMHGGMQGGNSQGGQMPNGGRR